MNDANEKHPGLVMGTAGHIDHGKTALVRSMTGVDLDRLEEEKRRGITIELGFVSLDLGEGFRIGVVDVPGHERFIKTMVAGAHGMDFVLLVVAADEGVMPQTVEHLDICKLLKIGKGLVALTKADKADDEMRELAVEEVHELVEGSFLEGAPIIPCSAVTGEGVDELKKEILEIAGTIKARSGDGIFRVPVDRSFSAKGFGTVVTGTIISGTVAKGDEVEILPGGKKATVRDLEVHGEKVARAAAGRRLAINLSGIERREVGRGRWVVGKNKIELTRSIDAYVSVLADHDAAIEHAHEIGFHTGTAFAIAELDLLGESRLEPGAEGPVRIHLSEKLPLLAGDKFVLRSYARKTTVAGGEIIDPHPRYRVAHRGRKGKRAGARFLSEMVTLDVGSKIEGLVETAAFWGVSKSTLYLRVPVSPDEIDAELAKLIDEGKIKKTTGKKELLISRGKAAELREEVFGILGGYHENHPLESGPGKGALKDMIKKRVPIEVFELVLGMLVDAKRVVAKGDKIRLATHSPDAAGSDRETLDKIEELLEKSGNTPPTLKVLAERAGVDPKKARPLMKFLVESGKAIKVSEDLYFHSNAVGTIRKTMEAYFEKNESIDPVAFKDLVGVSRKFAIPLLEYFDREKYTMRVGNSRVPRRDG